MLFFLENLVDLPKVKIRNVIQEGTEAFLILSCQEEEVKCNYCGRLTDELHQTNNLLIRDWEHLTYAISINTYGAEK
ncbi:MAG: hypothetical protein KA717_00830 [Woronichinia naegeliana WA131]|uniref:Uncharacterized protein n=1 Tax=Woronichinia naegeliana WA131 TaxID=2824559 RepID=A0A977KX67_9CYAN|nr:MAG: hypothetical protein KA717_00830 [Woronichinia naegeliana WA131]